MNSYMECPSGCNEEFAELCALSTSGELSAEELAVLEKHVSSCASCASLLDEYTSMANMAMAKLAADREQEVDAPFAYSEAKAEERFIAALHATQPSWYASLRSRLYSSSFVTYWTRLPRLVPELSISMAVTLLIVAGVAFELGHKTVKSATITAPSAVPGQTVVFAAETGELKLELAAAQNSLKTVTAKSADLEKQLAELTAMKASLAAQIGELTTKNDAETASLALASQQHDSLQQQLQETSSALIRAKEDLSNAQRDRQGTLLRVASLETEINGLHANLAVTNNSASNDERFLSADRDIRELMGARQLYIADVFDVQNNGTPSKPFGRVFYTKGKSLIFYAFDLQAQPEYREAKAFQAWGKPDTNSGKAISLGIFYMDNEQNRRWVLKSNNQQILEQINAVFVTVEPHGGSQKPTGKPFLEAYLHSLPPNHP
jgi:anti-sigma factor RsiW